MGKSYKQLSLAERSLLQTQLVLCWSPAAIAAGLQRARSTITREMARNGWVAEPEIAQRGRPRIAGGYRAEPAHKRACTLAAKPRVVRKLVAGSVLFGLVVAHLRRGLSPEQIAFTLGSMDEPVRLSYETIYTALYAIHPTDEDLSAGPRPCHADNCVPAFSPCCAAPIGIAACVRRARTGVSPSPT